VSYTKFDFFYLKKLTRNKKQETRTTSMTTIPRSEQLAHDELELKNWMTTPWHTHLSGLQRFTNIDYIHGQVDHVWVHGPRVVTQYPWPGAPHTDYEAPPPWYPTLQDVEDIITGNESVSMNGKLIQILQYRGRYNVDLNSPLLGEHISYIYSLCNEFESPIIHDTGFGEDEGVFDLYSEEDAEYPMEPHSPETLRIINLNLDEGFQGEEVDAITDSITSEPPVLTRVDVLEGVVAVRVAGETRNSLCSEGVNILDRIMDTDTRKLNEGDYLKLMNLFRDLHT
jgi:hypothetical protein